MLTHRSVSTQAIIYVAYCMITTDRPPWRLAEGRREWQVAVYEEERPPEPELAFGPKVLIFGIERRQVVVNNHRCMG